MMTNKQKCWCVSEEPQGIRPGPNAPTREVAERDCPCCGGDGMVTPAGADLFEKARMYASEWWNGKPWHALDSRQKGAAWMEAADE